MYLSEKNDFNSFVNYYLDEAVVVGNDSSTLDSISSNGFNLSFIIWESK